VNVYIYIYIYVCVCSMYVGVLLPTVVFNNNIINVIVSE